MRRRRRRRPSYQPIAQPEAPNRRRISAQKPSLRPAAATARRRQRQTDTHACHDAAARSPADPLDAGWHGQQPTRLIKPAATRRDATQPAVWSLLHVHASPSGHAHACAASGIFGPTDKESRRGSVVPGISRTHRPIHHLPLPLLTCVRTTRARGERVLNPELRTYYAACGPSSPARPTPLPDSRASRAAAGQATFGRGAVPGGRLVVATTLRLRARCGGGTEPVEARKDGEGPGKEEAAAAEELEVLEEDATDGGDEGRRPTDYDRRAHIFEESSRVFSALKHRHDDGHGVDGDDAAAETARHGDSGR